MKTGIKINKETPWTKLPVKVDLKRYLTRQILIEKYHLNKSKKIEMTEFFISKLHNCELYTNNNYPDWIFYVKKTGNTKTILFEKDKENKIIYIKNSSVWSIFEDKYGLNYSEIQSFTQSLLNEFLNLSGYKTITPERIGYAPLLDGFLNLMEYKTHDGF